METQLLKQHCKALSFALRELTALADGPRTLDELLMMLDYISLEPEDKSLMPFDLDEELARAILCGQCARLVHFEECEQPRMLMMQPNAATVGAIEQFLGRLGYASRPLGK